MAPPQPGSASCHRFQSFERGDARRSIRSRPVAATGLIALALLAGGCSDASFESTRQARRELQEAATAFSQVRLGQPTFVAASTEDPTLIFNTDLVARHAAVAARLRAIAATPSAAAAASLLLAEVHMAAGELQMAELLWQASLEARTSQSIASQARQAAFLAALGQSVGSAQPGRDADRFGEIARREATTRTQEERTLETLEDEAGDLADLGEEQEERFREEMAEVLRLRQEALRVSDIDAEELLHDAVRSRRVAERDRRAMADTEIERDEVQRRIADGRQRVAGSEELERAARGASDRLRQVDGRWGEEANRLGTDADQLRRSLQQELRQMYSASERPLQQIAERARSEFEQARQAAERAATGDASLADSARLLVVAALQQSGLLDLHLAEALGAEAIALESLATLREPANELGLVDRELRSVRSARDAAIERAREAIGDASDRLAALPAIGTGALVALRDQLAARLAEVSGRPAAGSGGFGDGEFGGDGFGGGGFSQAPVAAGPPFASPQALIAGLAAIEAGTAPSAPIGEIMVASSAGGRQMLRATGRFADAMQPIDDAMRDTFGAEASATAALASAGGMGGAGGMGMLTGWSSARILDQDADGATLSVGGDQVRLVSRNGSWFIDYEAIIAESGMDPGMLPMMAGMMEGMAQQMGTFFRMFAERVRDGEFQTPEAAMAAMQQEMMSAMGGMGGGMGGGFGR